MLQQTVVDKPQKYETCAQDCSRTKTDNIATPPISLSCALKTRLQHGKNRTPSYPPPHLVPGTSHRSSSISPCRSSLSMTATNDHNKQPTASNSWGVPGTVAACLATATILSSSIAAEASIAGVYADGSPLGDLERHGAPTMMVLSEGESVEGRADVTGLVAEMKSADSAGRLLNTMVKINDVVDADEEGVLENPFAKEVRRREGSNRNRTVVFCCIV